MINFVFTLGCLALSCAAVSVVYSLTSPGDAGRVMKETVNSFLLMFGGIILLAVIIVAISWLSGR